MESNSDTATVTRVSWALITPLIFAFALNAILGGIAQRLFSQGICRLSLPWDRATSEDWLETFFPAAWRDAGRLRELSSECVAHLHTDVSTAGLIAFFAAAMFTVLSFGRARLYVPYWFRPPPQGRPEIAFVLGMAAIACLGSAIYSLSYGVFINFETGSTRGTVRFNGLYISIFGYFMTLFELFSRVFIGVLFATWSCAFARLIWNERGRSKIGRQN